MGYVFSKGFTKALFDDAGLSERLKKNDFTFAQIKQIAFCDSYEWSDEEFEDNSAKFYAAFYPEKINELMNFLDNNKQEIINKLLSAISSTLFTKKLISLDEEIAALLKETQIDITALKNVIFLNKTTPMKYKIYDRSRKKIYTTNKEIIEALLAIKNTEPEIMEELNQAGDSTLTAKDRKKAMFQAIAEKKADRVNYAKQKRIDESAVNTERYLLAENDGQEFIDDADYMLDPNYDLDKLDYVRIYCDGAYRINENRGSYAYALCDENDKIFKEKAGFLTDETSQTAELIACLQAIKALKKPCKIEVFTDSEYLECYVIQREKFVKRDVTNYYLINKIIAARDKHILLNVEHTNPSCSSIFASVDHASKAILKR